MNLFHVDAKRVGDSSFKKINATNWIDFRQEMLASEEVQSWKSNSEEEWATKGYYLNMARWVDNDVFQATFKNRAENIAINDHVSMSCGRVISVRSTKEKENCLF